MLWLPKELAQLQGSNLVGFRDAVLKGWNKQHAVLFPALTKQFPDLFPTQHFRQGLIQYFHFISLTLLNSSISDL